MNDGDRIRFAVPPAERIHLGGFVGDASADGRDEMAGEGFPAIAAELGVSTFMAKRYVKTGVAKLRAVLRGGTRPSP